jgi:cell wall-associated NlpC family hydrolase
MTATHLLKLASASERTRGLASSRGTPCTIKNNEISLKIMKRLTLIVLLGLLVPAAAPILVSTVAVAALAGGGSNVTAPRQAPGSALGGIPAPMLVVYQRAATVCSGLSWTVLAAIGTIESDNGQSGLPGVRSGQNPAGAEGPMQFEPATFARYANPVPTGGANPPTPYDPLDAAYAAARLLCGNGAAGGGGLVTAIFAYNHSQSYVTEVLQLAGVLTSGARAVAEPTGAAQRAVQFALAQVGTPYRWGAEDPGVAFDCSGLAQASWAAAGVHLPRVAQDQFDAGPLLPLGTALQPGDLVFFGPPGGAVTHVGLVVDPEGRMVDAPHAGAVVRVEPFPVGVGSAWGSDIYLGATRPDGL